MGDLFSAVQFIMKLIIRLERNTMGIPIKLEVFEGPLDLLLHLIDKNKINIYDIPIVDITEQYLQYIREMQEQQLEIMSEFLVMAATLLNIKSKMLLPKEEKPQEEEVDPRQELVQRLLEYKMYKYASYELKDRQVEAEKVVFRKKNLPPEIAEYTEAINVPVLLENVNLQKLHQVFQSVLKRQKEKLDPVRSSFRQIEKEEINLSEKIQEIQEYGRKYKIFSFRELLFQQISKMDTIVTFLGILELMKIGQIRIYQELVFDDIQIEYIYHNF